MLLETLSNDQDSLIVYSRNTLDAEENFSMLFKNDPLKVPRKLVLYDICGVINNAYPKNIIAYRLMTNIPDMMISKSSLGCTVKIGEIFEIIYPDPVYAVRELELLTENEYYQGLRFRIQQVGLTTASIENSTHTFRELFQFDLDVIETQAQNDTVFVEALLHGDYRAKKKEEAESLTSTITVDNEDLFEGSEYEPLFHSLAGLEPPRLTDDTEQPRVQSAGKSVIEIFKTAPELKKYIKEKGKRIVLKFRQKF